MDAIVFAAMGVPLAAFFRLEVRLLRRASMSFLLRLIFIRNLNL